MIQDISAFAARSYLEAERRAASPDPVFSSHDVSRSPEETFNPHAPSSTSTKRSSGNLEQRSSAKTMGFVPGGNDPEKSLEGEDELPVSK